MPQSLRLESNRFLITRLPHDASVSASHPIFLPRFAKWTASCEAQYGTCLHQHWMAYGHLGLIVLLFLALPEANMLMLVNDAPSDKRNWHRAEIDSSSCCLNHHFSVHGCQRLTLQLVQFRLCKSKLRHARFTFFAPANNPFQGRCSYMSFVGS